jgi:MerR family transcriptional regulator/heat shock protein HspR
VYGLGISHWIDLHRSAFDRTNELFGVPNVDENKPVYIISAAADLLDVHSRTLYLYEEKGLLVPVRKGNRRFYSTNDLRWIYALRYLVHERGINLEGIRQLLALKAQWAYEQDYEKELPECQDWVGPRAPCWEEGMERFNCHDCPVYADARDGLCQDQKIPVDA